MTHSGETGDTNSSKGTAGGKDAMANGSLPDQIVESISISNAKSIAEQPAILANLALANQILNNNMQQQLAISQQQAMNQLTMATLAKCVALITGGGEPGKPSGQAGELMNALNGMYAAFRQMVDHSAAAAASATEPPEQPPAGGADP
jgi:hypothetical protein